MKRSVQAVMQPPVARPTPQTPHVDARKVYDIIAHRASKSLGNEEQYLVQWKKSGPNSVTLYSWHPVNQLHGCWSAVQKYLGRLREKRLDSRKILTVPLPERYDVPSRKRKSPSSDVASNSSSDAYKKAHATPSVICISSDEDERAEQPPTKQRPRPTSNQMYINCAPVVDQDGYITVKPLHGPASSEAVTLPTPAMQAHALDPQTPTSRAEYNIQMAFSRSLALIPGPRVTLDTSGTTDAPPLDFSFMGHSVLGEGVAATDPDTVVGCGADDTPGESRAGRCRPDMGAGQGCEYSRVCGCLEFAPVEEQRMTAAQAAKAAAGETMGLPKRFPYTSPTATNPSCLTSFYLSKRSPIYECNPRCACGPGCKTRVVQKGRRVPLTIFKTEARGWGLRSPSALRRGQFVDTYRGEIVPSKVADERQAASASKDCYLYDLDKHIFDEDGRRDEGAVYYTVDGEHVGGPTRFMNHSCEPNCGQYCVSTNKFDTRIYELAFFALRNIDAGEELTFDYLDADASDDEDDEEEDGGRDGQRRNKDPGELPENAQRCLCGAERCRKWLWT